METFAAPAAGAAVRMIVFDDVARELVHARIDGQRLVDDLALEHLFEFVIHNGWEAASCPDAFNQACPFSVSRYCCRRLRGLPGMVISTKPASTAGTR